MYSSYPIFKVGDKVLLTRTAVDWEDGWDNTWNSEMTKCVGHIGIVIGDNLEAGYQIEFNISGVSRIYSYPYFVLKLASDKGRIPELCSNFGEFDKIACKYAR